MWIGLLKVQSMITPVKLEQILKNMTQLEQLEDPIEIF